MPAVELGNFMKPSRVVLILDGGYSRHKADSVKNVGDGISKHSYSHALMAEMDCPPKSDSGHGQEENHQNVKD